VQYDKNPVTFELLASWDEMISLWDANAKNEYYQKIFLPLLNCAEELYTNNYHLEQYAARCVSSIES